MTYLRNGQLKQDVTFLKQEVQTLTENLSSSKDRCMDLNASYKGKSIECCELEEQYDADVARLNAQLVKCREESSALQEAVNKQVDSDTNRLLLESREKLAALTSERQCLLTSIEVLEADVRALRAELRRAESRLRQRPISADDSLLVEMTISKETNDLPPISTPVQHVNTPDVNSGDLATAPSVPLQTLVQTPSLYPLNCEFKDVLLIGDSHMRYASRKCVLRGAYLECCPGGKISDIKNRLLSYVGVNLSVIYIHVGANNLRKGYRGGPGYNGGHGKRETLHSMADLLYTVKTNFQNSKIFLNSILIRSDIGYKALYDFNDQLDLMCNNFQVEFVEANTCVGRRDLARDGVHFTRRGVSRLGSLFVKAISSALWSLDAASACPLDSPGEALSGPGWSPEPGNTIDGVHGIRGSLDCSQVPEN